MSIQSTSFFEPLKQLEEASRNTIPPVEILPCKQLDIDRLNIRIKNLSSVTLNASVFQNGTRTYLRVMGPLNEECREISEFVHQATQQIFYIYKDSQPTVEELFNFAMTGSPSPSEEGKSHIDEDEIAQMKKNLSENIHKLFSISICVPGGKLPDVVDAT